MVSQQERTEIYDITLFKSRVGGPRAKKMPPEAGKVKEPDFPLKLPGKRN